MTLNIKLLTILIVLFVNTSIAQTTTIPDAAFEQALIDLGIDSDGVVNGQVLTADVENIVELDFSTLSSSEIIFDLTGIEDFAALEILNFDFSHVILDETQEDIFSSNVNLRELTMRNPCGDCIGNAVQILNLSGLLNLELVDLEDVIIDIIKFNNPNHDLTNLTLNLYHEGFPGGDWSQHVCIVVADPQTANNNQFPYNTWNITQNSFIRTYGFAATCTLSVNDFDKLNSISAYPNPVKDKLWIENPNQVQLKSVKVFTIQGKIVKSFADVEDVISIPELESGVYFVKINDTVSFKILKE